LGPNGLDLEEESNRERERERKKAKTKESKRGRERTASCLKCPATGQERWGRTRGGLGAGKVDVNSSLSYNNHDTPKQ
jgi:hypothetical protein